MSALVNLGDMRLWWPPPPSLTLSSLLYGSSGTSALNAAGYKTAFIGNVYISGRPVGAKTISAAGGGSISFTPGTNTFADAGTNLRVGIQDADTSNSPVVPDGTHDVYADLVPGSVTLTGGTWYEADMSSGTKSITHGQEIAIVFEMT